MPEFKKRFDDDGDEYVNQLKGYVSDMFDGVEEEVGDGTAIAVLAMFRTVDVVEDGEVEGHMCRVLTHVMPSRENRAQRDSDDDCIDCEKSHRCLQSGELVDMICTLIDEVPLQGVKQIMDSVTRRVLNEIERGNMGPMMDLDILPTLMGSPFIDPDETRH